MFYFYRLLAYCQFFTIINMQDINKIEVEKLFSYLPDNAQLAVTLTDLIEKKMAERGEVVVLKREKNSYTSTHPSEIITYEINGIIQKRLFLKYEFEDYAVVNDHRKNLRHESSIYSDVLTPIKMSIPEYYGFYIFEQMGIKMMVLEFVENMFRFPKTSERDPIYKVAKWIGEFHSRSKHLLQKNKLSFINQYNEKYYLQWPQKTIDIIWEHHLEYKYEWFLKLVEKFKNEIKMLTDIEPVVIHGEFYPINIYRSNGIIYPIDWQTAALATGAVDMAALTHNWPVKVQEKCLAVYKAACGLTDSIELLKRRVLLARIYLNFLWLGYEHEAVINGHKFLDELKEFSTQI